MVTHGVPVRGKCPVGHVLNTTSLPGRLTWRGPCPTDGCGRDMVARRIPIKDRTPDPAGDTPPAPDAPARKRRVRKVASYRDDNEPRFEDQPQRRRAPAGGDPTGVQTPAGDPEPGPAGPGDVDGERPDGEPERRPGLIERARARSAQRRRQRLVERDDVIPGIYG